MITLLDKTVKKLLIPSKRTAVMKTVPVCRIYTDAEITLVDGTVIPPNTIGGFVQSLDNIQDGWVANTAMVYDQAVLKGGSLIQGIATVCGNAIIIASVIQGKAFIGDGVVVESSSVDGRAKLFDKAKIVASVIKESTLVEGSAKVTSSTLAGGCIVSGQATVTASKLSGTSEVRGSSVVVNCSLSGRVVVEEGRYSNQSSDRVIELKVDAPERDF